MDVDAVLEGLAQRRDFGHLGQQPQFDLRIVGRHQLHAGRGDEGAADLAAFFGAHRDILQIRLGRRQPAGRGGGERVTGVHAVGGRVDVSRQRLGVCRAQLRHLPPVENLARQLVALLGQFFEFARAGRPLAGLGFRAARQVHLAEQNVAELLGRAGIERLAGQRLDFFLQRALLLGEFAGQP